ncbi:VOC family protein [Cellulomonas sp.]|uniref:VOC family protein n=1 Tax=Cellulomonas sp. TaxID=40001 RepID=UPI001B208EB9|nr:VOC family protein [Cellulomonas sp.]MBO9554292.1 VOC family protein [Cellulomonas sp.]
MGRIHTHLWFADQAEQAAEFYVSLIPNSSITSVVKAPPGVPDVPEGAVFVVDLLLDDHQVTLLNAGPAFQLDEAFSFVLDCGDQAEIDHYWDALVAGGGEHSQCGWLKDRFGVSWQVVPAGFNDMLGDDADPAARARAMAAVLTMTKLDIAAIEAAFEGTA